MIKAFVLALALCPSIFARHLEVIAEQTPVYTQPTRHSPLLKILKKGENPECRNRVGNYWEILLNDQKWGFVLFTAVEMLPNTPGLFEKIEKEEDSLLEPEKTSASELQEIYESEHPAVLYPPNLRRLYYMDSEVPSKKGLRSIEEGVSEEIHRQVERINSILSKKEKER